MSVKSKSKRDAYGKLEKISKHSGFYKNPVTGIIYWRGRINGEAFKKSCGTTKITEAKNYIDEFKSAAINNPNEKRTSSITNPTVESLWQKCLDERDHRDQSTLVGYESSWNKMRGFWSDKNLSSITKQNITKFEKWFLATYPDQVFFNTRKHFIMLLNFLHRNGYLRKKLLVSDLDKVIDARTKKKKHFRVYTKAEQNRLLKNASSDLAYTGLVLYFDTGVRKMELLSREIQDFNTRKGTLNVWSSKNKKWRELPLTKRSIQALKDWLELKKPSKYIFQKARSEEPLSSQLFDKAWVETKKLAKITGKARIHDIRHTFATKTARDEWPVPHATKMLDMTADVYLRTYVHINPSDLAKFVERSFE